MRKMLVTLAIITLLSAACTAPQPEATPEPAAVGIDETIMAEAKVVPAQAATLSLPVGGMVAEVLVAEGSPVTAGQAILRLDTAHARAAVGQAEAAVRRAEAALAELEAGPRPEEVAVAAAALAQAQARLGQLQAGSSEEEIAAARAEANNAEAALRQAQAAYDPVSWHPSASARREALALEQATNAYAAAQARLDALVRGPRPADLAVAQAEVAHAQAQLNLVEAGARPETVAAAQADVAAAQAALEEAQAALANLELCAPFAGTVAWLDARAGEQVAAGQPLVHLGDLSTWQFETEDLAELDVVRVREGAAATITLDALPEVELQGTVTHIRAYGESRQGDIVYRAIIVPEEQDPRLRWNMTAFVSIEPQ